MRHIGWSMPGKRSRLLNVVCAFRAVRRFAAVALTERAGTERRFWLRCYGRQAVDCLKEIVCP